MLCTEAALSWVSSEDIDQFLCAAVGWLSLEPDTAETKSLLGVTADILATMHTKFAGAEKVWCTAS